MIPQYFSMRVCTHECTHTCVMVHWKATKVCSLKKKVSELLQLLSLEATT